MLAVFVKETKGLEFGTCGRKVVFRASEGFSSYCARFRQSETRKCSWCGERVIFLAVWATKILHSVELVWGLGFRIPPRPCQLSSFRPPLFLTFVHLGLISLSSIH